MDKHDHYEVQKEHQTSRRPHSSDQKVKESGGRTQHRVILPGGQSPLVETELVPDFRTLSVCTILLGREELIECIMNVVDFQKKSAPGSNQGKTDKEI